MDEVTPCALDTVPTTTGYDCCIADDAAGGDGDATGGEGAGGGDGDATGGEGTGDGDGNLVTRS
eukprot:1288377-Prymnesium_polylepis.2